MNFLIVFALILVSANSLSTGEIKSRDILIPAGQPEGRITRGQRAVVQQFPYQVGLSLKLADGNYTWCGGSLISNEWVLTAAHCVVESVEVEIILGTTDRFEPKVSHTVSRYNIVVHSNWNFLTGVHDIALIKIPFTKYTNYIKPVKLPTMYGYYNDYAGEKVIVAGWGQTSDSNPDTPQHLQYARRRVCSNSEVISKTTLCIETVGGVSTCFGDSGGPLVLESIGIQIGIVSYGTEDKCEQGSPVVFTRVTSYLYWIAHHTGISY